MWEWVKHHPYLTGTLGLLIVLFFVFRSRSSSSASGGTVVQSGPSDAAIQSADALQAAQIQANTQVQGYQAALGAAQLQAGVAVVQSTNAQQVQLASVAAQQNVDLAKTAAELQLGLAQLGQSPSQPASLPTTTPTVVGVGTQSAAATATQSAAASAVSNLPVSSQTVPTPTPNQITSAAGIPIYQFASPSADQIAAANAKASFTGPSAGPAITPTSLGTQLPTGVLSPAGFGSESDYLAALQTQYGYGGGQCNDPVTCGNIPGFESIGTLAASEWIYNPASPHNVAA